MRRNWMLVLSLFMASLAAIIPPLIAQGAPGAVYTMTNAAGPNEVIIYSRSSDGTLTPTSSVLTGGEGTGTGLGNQGAVVLSQNNRWLLVVNAGSNDISVFGVHPHGLTLIDREPSGGLMPVSVTVHGRLVYVLHAGMPNNITGFILSPKGELTALPDSARALSALMTGPAQVQFSPDGGFLVVTEKATNTIDVFAVGLDGLPGSRVPTPSNGATPFGFSFGLRDQLFVSEAFGGTPDASAVSSYVSNGDGTLTLITGSAATTETAACWVIVTGDGRFAYTTNTGSGSITGYGIGTDGSLTILDADGRTGITGPGSAPIDLALSVGSRFLYSLDSGDAKISAFRVTNDGGLESIGTIGSPTTANGLAAR